MRLWIGKLNTLHHVRFLAHIDVIVLEREKSKIETFNVATLSQLMSQIIGHLVVRLHVPNRVIVWEHLRNIVEAVADANVFD